ncbi:MAG TPA: cytochrome c [Polyangiaceae bacterium]|nr:cytochrome c [Polyangiaceae bacterium]
MNQNVKRVLKTAGVVLGVAIGGGGAFFGVQVSRFDASMDRAYDVPVPTVERSTDAAVLARGKHLVESVAPCASKACHGADLGGGEPIDIGPIGTLVGPNITPAGVAVAYSDGEIARLVKHGIKKDGRTVRFMPVQDFTWLPDSDVTAIVSHLRTVAPVDRPNAATVIKPLGKMLDRQDKFIIDVARRIDHAKIEPVPTKGPTAEYGAFLARLCHGCHGEHLSGGPIPGAPSSIPIPLNLTPDPSGLKDWSFDDFDRLMRTAVRKSGKPLNPFMPVESWRNFDDTEMHALWAHLRTLPPTAFGNR